MQFLWLIPFGLVLGGIAFSDAKKRIIPNEYVAGLVLLSFAYGLVEKGELPYMTMILAFVFCLFFYAVARNGIGMGDLKMIWALSCLFSLEYWIYDLVLSSLLAILAKPVFHRGEKTVPFGVYLAAGTFILLWSYIQNH